MERETIALKKERMTLRRMKKLMRDYSRRPVIDLDTWRKGRKSIDILKSELKVPEGKEE